MKHNKLQAKIEIAANEVKNVLGDWADADLSCISDIGIILNEWTEETVLALMPIMKIINDICWNAYREAGMPYGENGMLRWLESKPD